MWKIHRGTIALRTEHGAEPPAHLRPLVRVRGRIWQFRTRHALWVADVLQGGSHRELQAAFPKSLPPDLLDSHAVLEARADLANAADPSQLKHVLAQEVVREIIRRLRPRMPYVFRPHPFQLLGTAYAALHDYRCGIFDEQGLGKTVSALAALAYDPGRLLPAAVVCPASVYGNWRREIERWLPGVEVAGLPIGLSTLPWGFRGVVILTWDGVRRHSRTLIAAGINTMIGDEAHYIKNEDARRSQGGRTLAHAVPHCMLLTGTPIKNRASEIWHLLHCLDPVAWPSMAAFSKEYLQEPREGDDDPESREGDDDPESRDPDLPRTKIEDDTGASRFLHEETPIDLQGLHDKLQTISIRRLKETILPWLPEKRRVVLPVQLSAAQRAEYDRAEKEFADWLEGELSVRVAKALKAKGVLDPAEADARLRETVERKAESALEAQALVKIGYLRRLTGRFKIAHALNHIAQVVGRDESIVVFCEHLDLVDALEGGLKRLKIPFATIAGSVTKKRRTAIVEAFQGGKLRVFLGTQAAKEGLTLTHAWNTLFVERWWSPADEEQGEDRCHRIGQTRGTVVWYMEATETVDGRIAELIESKRELIAQAVGAGKVIEDRVRLVDFQRQFRRLEAHITHRQQLRRERNARHGAPSAPPRKRAGPPPKKHLHAVLFDTRIWSEAEAKRWLLREELSARKLEHRTGRLLFEQKPRKKFASGRFRTRPGHDGITFLLGKAL